MRKRTRLDGLYIDEVSLVRNPANRSARVDIGKSADLRASLHRATEDPGRRCRVRDDAGSRPIGNRD